MAGKARNVVQTRAVNRRMLQQNIGQLVDEYIEKNIKPYFPLESSPPEPAGCLDLKKDKIIKRRANPTKLKATSSGQFQRFIRAFKCKVCKDTIPKTFRLNVLIDTSEFAKNSQILWDKGFELKICRKCLSPIVKLKRCPS